MPEVREVKEEEKVKESICCQLVLQLRRPQAYCTGLGGGSKGSWEEIRYITLGDEMDLD